MEKIYELINKLFKLFGIELPMYIIATGLIFSIISGIYVAIMYAASLPDPFDKLLLKIIFIGIFIIAIELLYEYLVKYLINQWKLRIVTIPSSDNFGTYCTTAIKAKKDGKKARNPTKTELEYWEINPTKKNLWLFFSRPFSNDKLTPDIEKLRPNNNNSCGQCILMSPKMCELCKDGRYYTQIRIEQPLN
jgi:hypothetical protein